MDATSIDYNSCGLLLCGIDSLCSYNLHAMQLMQPRQPIPQVTAEDVERVARRDFSADEYGTVMAALSEYGTEKWQREAARVQLAVPRLELATNLIRALNPETGPTPSADRR